ncbi:LigA [Patulibacter medicamentivorans]|uniref:LigA n=1 Tax=Patulibacter medicamentivorans TaxID=1097667 RepID=H0E1U2_9ACTN|nr:LigA [Patulibacter medicamentivorans]
MRVLGRQPAAVGARDRPRGPAGRDVEVPVGERGAGEDLAAGDVARPRGPQDRTAAHLQQDVAGGRRTACFQQRGGGVEAAHARDQPRIGAGRQADRLLAGAQRLRPAALRQPQHRQLAEGHRQEQVRGQATVVDHVVDRRLGLVEPSQAQQRPGGGGLGDEQRGALPGLAGHPHDAGRGLQRRGVALEHRLGPAEPEPEVEPGRQLVVDEPGEPPGGVVERRLRRAAQEVLGERDLPGGDRRQRRQPQAVGVGQRAARPLVHLRRSRLVAGAGRQLDLQPDRVLGLRVDRGPGRRQADSRVAVAAQQVLDAGAARCDGGTLRSARRQQLEDRAERAASAIELAGPGGCLGLGQSQVDASCRRVGRLGHEAGRRRVPAGGQGRRPLAVGVPGGAQQGDRRLVPRHGRALDVGRPGRQVGALGGQVGRDPRVGADQPAAAGAGEHRRPHDRVAERQLVRGGPGQQAGRHQGVGQVGQLVLGDVGGAGGDAQPARVAGHGRALEQPPLRCRQRRQLALERRPHGRRDAGGVLRRRQRTAALLAVGVCEREQEERGATALAMEVVGDRRRHRVAEQGAAGLDVERAKLQAQRLALAVGRRERAVEHRRQLGRTQAQRQAHRAARWSRQQVREQLDRRRVGPVQVVEHEQDRMALGDRRQQLPDRAVGAMALLRRDRGRRAGGRAEGRQRGSQRVGVGPGQRGPLGDVERSQPVVDGVTDDPERRLALELRRAALQHQPSARGGDGGQLPQQPALADPGRARDLDGPSAVAEDADHRGELRIPRDQRATPIDHPASLAKRGGPGEGCEGWGEGSPG